MNAEALVRLTERFRDAVEDVAPFVARLAAGRHAISVGGSIGKGVADERSDVDPRLFCERRAPKAPSSHMLFRGESMHPADRRHL